MEETELKACEGDGGMPETAAKERGSGDAQPEKLYVVGVGASAGGLESLERLFRNMPVNTGMAFVVIQHLSPDFKSLMDELLARYTRMSIHRAEDGMFVEPNSIYLIPPRKEMIIARGRLLLTDKDPKQTLTMPIDRFFRSLAQDCGDRAIAIVLSGTGSDGSRGICDIHAAGGLVISESKETAKFDGMPVAAMDTGVVDLVLAPEAMPNALIQHVDRIVSGPLVSGGQSPADTMGALLKLLNDECGIDFSHYKPNTVVRRVQRRLALLGVATLNEYVERLQADEEERNALYKDLLIGVTRFFRDQEAFAKLEEVVIPEILRKAGEEEEIRVWVAGCATGEEAYSVAMLIHEQMERLGRRLKAKIFATDVHRASLNVAAAGVYQREALAGVSPQRVKRYFELKRDGYHVIPELRQCIVFAPHNLINDAPFTKLDLITCRNLLIYLDPAAQKLALSLFHFGLKTSGILFLGTSETPGELQDEFEPIDLHWKIFRKSRDLRLPNDIRLPPLVAVPGVMGRPVAPIPPSPTRGLPDASLVGAYDVMLNRFMPPGLLINERRELLHTFGGAERYLQLKGGRPTTDVFDLLDQDLRTAVTGAVQRALKDSVAVSYSGVHVGGEQGQPLKVTVEPIHNSRSRFKQLLVLLTPQEVPARAPEGAGGSPETDLARMSRDRIESLEVELRYNKENLQSTIEELETSNEELQSANEELVTSNEELQSTNEELQSVNEELYTVNAEYQKKITELSELTADMENLLAGTEIGTIFLDRDLCIRKFTPQIATQFHLLPQDVGRPIDSFASSIVHPGLMDDLRRVMATNEKCERDVEDQQGRWHYLRILPYRMKGKSGGVVLTLVDITPVKNAQKALSEAIRRRDQFLAMLSHELRNPLGAILNAANIMERLPGGNEVIAQASEVVRRQGQTMARLLDDLLDVSRVTQNKIEMRKEATSIRSITEGAIESVKPLLAGGELKLTTKVHPTEVHVYGDGVRLQQALTNLLVNAAKYTPPGGQVQLEVFPEQQQIVMRVTDTGIGIAPEQMECIFELFVQGEQSLQRSKGGMGVGLTLVRSIVEQHGGTVTAKSEGPGKGSQFEIRLPRLAEHEAPTAESPKGGGTQTALKDGSIVIIEDQDDNRHMLRALLELDGYRVITAEDGTKGLAAIEQHRPDVALVDIGLPGITGYDIAKQVREKLKNDQTYLIALTGYGQPHDVQAAFEAGFDSHIVKPFDPKKLAQLLERRRQRPLDGAVRAS